MENQPDNQKMGAFIQGRRAEKGLTQKELGKQMGVSDKAVSKWERGHSFPDITLLPRLAGALDATLGELIAGEAFTEDRVNTRKMNEVVSKTLEYKRMSGREKRRVACVAVIAIAALALVFWVWRGYHTPLTDFETAAGMTGGHGRNGLGADFQYLDGTRTERLRLEEETDMVLFSWTETEAGSIEIAVCDEVGKEILRLSNNVPWTPFKVEAGRSYTLRIVADDAIKGRYFVNWGRADEVIAN